jgi:hypothetical protein
MAQSYSNLVSLVAKGAFGFPIYQRFLINIVTNEKGLCLLVQV